MTDRRTAVAGLPLPSKGLPPAASRSAATNRPASRWNANTTGGRRARDLFHGFVTQLGTPTDAPTLSLILTAVERVVIAENARHDHLTGVGGVTLNDIVRLERAADKALARLKLDKQAAAPKKTLIQKLQEQEQLARAAATGADGGGVA
jgi:hypothetical protein